MSVFNQSISLLHSKAKRHSSLSQPPTDCSKSLRSAAFTKEKTGVSNQITLTFGKNGD